jgi:hypothetical protein
MKGHRKFLFALIAMALASVMLAWGKLESGSYTAIMIAAISGYLVTNAAQAVGVRVAERPRAETTTVLPSPPAVQIDARSQG